jgi:Ca2+:H+ antiporter
MRTALAALAAATLATAFVSEALVHSLEGFAKAAGLTEFFIAAIIVAVVGNAAEHGGAVVIARTPGKMQLASEIAISSSAQVALFVTPAVALLSWVVKPALPLAFRWEEVVAMAGATFVVALVVRHGETHRWEGYALIAAFAAIAVWFLLA